jgi:hypothetical protein
MPLAGFDGLMIGDDQLHLTFSMPPNSDAPIRDSRAKWQGFNYDTGMQPYQDKAGPLRVRATVSLSRPEK